MDNRDRKILEKVLNEIIFLQKDTKGVTREIFLSDERLKRSVAIANVEC